jgi:DNA-binding GntR family transcriptional regulator
LTVRYRAILDELRDRVANGTYKLGAHLPTEEALCAEFDASRHTVREAMRRLVAQGVVVRRPKQGTIVTATEPQRSYVQGFSSIASLFQFALDTHYQVLDMHMEQVDAAIAAAIGGAAGESWLRVDGVRREREGGPVICTTTSYIPERLAWIGPELPGCVGPFYALIERRTGEAILHAVQEINAEPMRADLAALIGQKGRGIALCLLRRYLSDAGTLIASYNRHPADRFTYRMQFDRDDTA